MSTTATPNTTTQKTVGFQLSKEEISQLNVLGQVAVNTVRTKRRIFGAIASVCGITTKGVTYVQNAHRFIDTEGIIHSAVNEARASIVDPLNARDAAIAKLRVRAAAGEMMDINIGSQEAILEMLVGLGMPVAEAHAELRKIGIELAVEEAQAPTTKDAPASTVNMANAVPA